MDFPALLRIDFSSGTVNGIVRWSASDSLSRSVSSGWISATTFRWAWVSLTGKCPGVPAIVSLLVRGHWQALPQDKQEVDEELRRPLPFDQLGGGPDPRPVFNQPGEGAE